MNLLSRHVNLYANLQLSLASKYWIITADGNYGEYRLCFLFRFDIETASFGVSI